MDPISVTQHFLLSGVNGKGRHLLYHIFAGGSESVTGSLPSTLLEQVAETNKQILYATLFAWATTKHLLQGQEPLGF